MSKDKDKDRPADDMHKHPLGEYLFDGFYMMPDGNIVTEDEMYGYIPENDSDDDNDDEAENQEPE